MAIAVSYKVRRHKWTTKLFNFKMLPHKAAGTQNKYKQRTKTTTNDFKLAVGTFSSFWSHV